MRARSAGTWHSIDLSVGALGQMLVLIPANFAYGSRADTKEHYFKPLTDMIEIIGDRSVFQIYCVHEPFPGSHGYDFGRMCLRFDEDTLGDLNEPACSLNVTAGHFDDALNSITEHDEPELSALTDEQLWERLDCALYRDDNRTIEQVVADARRLLIRFKIAATIQELNDFALLDCGHCLALKSSG